MARIDKRRTTGARANAQRVTLDAARSGSMGGSIEDTMFFPRLRRHAKWMFVFLAVVFGLGFTLFGIGAGGTGFGDLLKGNSGGGGGPNVKKALEATQTRPQDAAAWLALADVYRTTGRHRQGRRGAAPLHAARAEERRRPSHPRVRLLRPGASTGDRGSELADLGGVLGLCLAGGPGADAERHAALLGSAGRCLTDELVERCRPHCKRRPPRCRTPSPHISGSPRSLRTIRTSSSSSAATPSRPETRPWRSPRSSAT